MYEYYFGHCRSSIQANSNIKVVIPWERLSNERDERCNNENGDEASEPANERDGKST